MIQVTTEQISQAESGLAECIARLREAQRLLDEATTAEMDAVARRNSAEWEVARAREKIVYTLGLER